jgi:hypothetical protein
MKQSNYRIFRADAIQRYSSARQAPVFPRLVSPPAFACLWITVALFLTAGLGAWLFKFPIHVSGSATAVKNPNGEIVILAFFSPEQLPQLRVGQKVLLLSNRGSRFFGTIIAVNPEVFNPYVARRQLSGALDLEHLISEPSAVALARTSRLGFLTDAYLGNIFRAEVEVGSRRIISLLPAIGTFFRG